MSLFTVSGVGGEEGCVLAFLWLWCFLWYLSLFHCVSGQLFGADDVAPESTLTTTSAVPSSPLSAGYCPPVPPFPLPLLSYLYRFGLAISIARPPLSLLLYLFVPVWVCPFPLPIRCLFPRRRSNPPYPFCRPRRLFHRPSGRCLPPVYPCPQMRGLLAWRPLLPL